MKVLVLTISDRASQGIYEDKSGPAIEAVFSEKLPDALIERRIVPDEEGPLLETLLHHLTSDVIITTGGLALIMINFRIRIIKYFLV